MEPEDAEGFWDCSRAHDKVSKGKHGQEIVHGPVQSVHLADEAEKSAIPYHSYNIHRAEWEGNPEVHVL